MKKLINPGFLSIALGVGTSLPAFAQDRADSIVLTPMPHLATALIGGVVLAFGFQIVLTIVSFAGGLSLTPNLIKQSAKNKADRLAGATATAEEREEPEHKHNHMLCVVNELGIWALVTGSVSLFLATWLALRVSYIADMESRYVLAAIIWAAFLLLASYLEWKSARSIIGTVTNIAASGFHAGSGLLHDLVTKSPARQFEDASRHTLQHFYKQLSHAARKNDIASSLGNFLREFKPDGLDYDRIHDEVANVIKEVKDLPALDVSEEKLMRLMHKKLESKHPVVTRANAKRLVSTISRAARSVKKANRSSDGIYGIAEAVMPLAEGQARELREKLETYLSKTKRDELDPEAIRADIEKMVSDPKSAVDLVKARLAHFDRDTVKSIIAQNDNFDARMAEKIVDTFMDAVGKIQSKYNETKSATGKKAQALQKTAADLPQIVEDKINEYLDSYGIPEMNLNSIRTYLEDMLHNAEEAPQMLRERLGELNKEKVMEMIKANPFISQEQAQSVISHVLETRDDVMKRIAEVEDKATVMYENARRHTAIASEHARKASIAASWWLVFTAIASLAAALGGAYFSNMMLFAI